MASMIWMEQKRLTKRLTDHWDRLRKDLPLPPWEKFNITPLEDIWGQCCVWRVDVIGVNKRINQYTYEYVGRNAQEVLGVDLTGTVFISSFQRFIGARVTERVDEAVEKGNPIIDEGVFVNEHNKVVKYRSCLLPFGTKEGRVTRLLLGLSWRAF